jgi:5-methylcytosine-specific restriction endonuclease McrA
MIRSSGLILSSSGDWFDSMSGAEVTLRLCSGCFRAFPPQELRRSRCPACIKVYERARSSAHQRGYTKQHQRLAKQAIAAHPWCADCHSTEDLCADHIVPLSRGGTNTQSNYQIRCRSCNTARRNVDRRKRSTKETRGRHRRRRKRTGETRPQDFAKETSQNGGTEGWEGVHRFTGETRDPG